MLTLFKLKLYKKVISFMVSLPQEIAKFYQGIEKCKLKLQLRNIVRKEREKFMKSRQGSNMKR
jgi:hypothetical protein